MQILHSGSALNSWIEQHHPGEWRINSRIARAVGRSRISVSNWRNGSTLPDGKAMVAVARFTGGDITPDDWFPELRDLHAASRSSDRVAA